MMRVTVSWQWSEVTGNFRHLGDVLESVFEAVVVLSGIVALVSALVVVARQVWVADAQRTKQPENEELPSVKNVSTTGKEDK